MNALSPDRFPYYDSARLVAEVFSSAFLPPERASVADHAAQHRWLANEGGGYVGRWRHDLAPYLRQPMELLNTTAHTTVAVVGPGQCGKTAIAENWLLASVAADPADLLWYTATKELQESYVKQRINPMIFSHPALRDRLGTRPTDDSLSFKRFQNMTAQFLVTTHSALISKSAPRIVVDEWDAADPSLGDLKTLIDVRRQTFGRESTVLALSHCDRAGGMEERHWNAGIAQLYRDSDRRMWWWRCAECGAWSSPHPLASRVMTLDYPQDAPLDEIAEAAVLICPVNGCVLDDSRRREMNLTGDWFGLGQTVGEDGEVEGRLLPRDTAGFWITGIMSPFILGGIGGLARARAKAERERDATGDDKALRQVVVKQFGYAYDPPRRVGSLSATEIADRAEPALKLGQVPEGVRFLTAGVDVQGGRFELLVRGWGEFGESSVLHVEKIAAAPATSPADWTALLARLLAFALPLADGSGRVMRLRAAAIDSGGEPGVTALAYDAWRAARAAGRIRLRGRVDGRDAWSIVLAKGLGRMQAQRLAVVYPATARRDRRVNAAGTVPLAQFNANTFKDALAGQLARTEPGPWTVHIPAGLRAAEPPHPWFEQLVAETRTHDGRWENPTGARNEAMDLMVLSHVAAELHGLGRINWSRPPAWAAEWNANAMVSSPDLEPDAPAVVPGIPAATPAPAVIAAARPSGPRLATRLA